MASSDLEGSGSEIVILDKPEDGPQGTPLPLDLHTEWKTNKPTLGRIHFLRHLMTSGNLADVTFSLKREDGEIEKIKAHKSILKVKSDFFAALFSDRWENNEVDLSSTDINNVDFKTFLQYIYLKEITLNAENVMALYSITHMYNVADLKQMCENFLRENFVEEDVISLFKTVFLYASGSSGNALLNTLTAFICRNGESFLENPEILELSMAQLSVIFSYDTPFSSSPFKVMRFCLKWTEKKFGRQKLEEFEELDRMFRLEMNLNKHFFSKLPRLSFLRTPEENKVRNDPNSSKKAEDSNSVYEVKRFGGRNDIKPWKYRRHHADRFSFRCSQSILLTGLGLYGDRQFGPAFCFKRFRMESDVKPAKYDVDVRVYYHGKGFKELMYAFRRGGQDMDLSSCIFNVDFNPLYLQADQWYTVSVRIAGPPSYFGKEGVREKIIRCANIPVLFEFQDACSKDEEAKLSNATGFPMGQIPKLFFKLIADKDDDVNVLDP